MLESAGRRPRATRAHHLRVHTACEHSLRAQRARTACVHSVQSRMHSDAMRRWRAALVHTKRQLTRNKHVQPSGLDRRRQPLLPLPPCPPARPPYPSTHHCKRLCRQPQQLSGRHVIRGPHSLNELVCRRAGAAGSGFAFTPASTGDRGGAASVDGSVRGQGRSVWGCTQVQKGNTCTPTVTPTQS